MDYFYCSRSGFFREQGKGLRALKTQGSSKIDSHCTASIKLTHIYKGKVQVTICKSDYGHDLSLGHIRLTREARLAIAGQLYQGVSFDRVLDNTRDTVGEKFERIHLVSKKDLHNIEQAFHLRGAERHSSDATSVTIWAEEMKVKPDNNPILLYKPQGKVSAKETRLGINDFILVLPNTTAT